MSPLLLRIGVVLSWTVALASCASEPAPAPVSEPPSIAAPVPVPAPSVPEEDEDEITGKSLYMRHCAGCHNDNGDGRGATMMAQGKQARSFAQGGFAFGNTPEAIFKTITSGIPGSSLMQPFNGVMDDDERRLVAEYVLTLTPYKAEVKSADSVMVVGERAVFAYGKLPPIHEGLPEHPRGLMVGLPGGLSFEYRVDDVRLLAVRRGAFVDREDWNDRGGGYLKPLGEIVEELSVGEDLPWIHGWRSTPPIKKTADGRYVQNDWGELRPGAFPLRIALDSATTLPNGVARLEYTLSPDLSRNLQRVERGAEELSAIELDGARGYRRKLTFGAVHMLGSDPNVRAVLASWPTETEMLRGGPKPTKAPIADDPNAPLEGWQPLEDAWVVTRASQGFEARWFAPHKGMGWMTMGGRKCVVANALAWNMEVVVLETRMWDEDRLRRWAMQLESSWAKELESK